MAHLATASDIGHERRLAMTYEQFLESEYAESHAEWIDGEVIVFMPPSTRHMQIARFLTVLLTMYSEAFNLGEMLFAPFEMRIRPDRSFREPDILFVAREHLDRLGPRRLNGPADLVIEIVSPDSVARDRADKFDEYQAAGVGEYLLIDPRSGKERADFYRLDADGKYEPVLADDDAHYHFATLPGFWLDSRWLWQEPIPNALAALAAIAPERFGVLARTAGEADG